MLTLSDVEVQTPLVMVQRKMVVPEFNPETSLVGEFAFEKVAEPLTTVHVPFPIAGLFAASVVVEKQMVWSEPAFEVDGGF